MSAMQKINLGTALQFKEALFSFLVVVSFALGTYLTIKLIPINKSIDILTIKVDAQQEVDDNCSIQIIKMSDDITIIKADTAYIRGFLDR